MPQGQTLNNMKPIITMTLISAMTAMSAIALPPYPKAPSDGTVDDYFGHKVADPYRPLEDDTASVTTDWVNTENRITREYLEAIPFRGKLAERLTKLNNFAKIGVPSKGKDGKYYWSANDGLQNQNVIYRSDKPYGEAEVVLDPNSLSDDGTVALTGLVISPDGKYIAYTISRSGSDWTEIFVLDAKTLKPLPDHIEWAKFTGAEWNGDGFYYSAYPRPEAGKEFSNANEYHSVYFHRLGTPQSEDKVVFENRQEPLRFHLAGMTEDLRYLYIYGSGQGTGNMMLVKRADDPKAEFTVIEPTQEKEIKIVGSIGDTLYLYTNIDAPRYRLVAVDPARPERSNWRTVVPESDDVLNGVAFTDHDKLILLYDHDAANRAFLAGIDGKIIREIELPTYGSVSFSTDMDSDEVFYAFTSFTYPTANYTYDIHSGKSTFLRQNDVPGLNPDDYVTEQVFYTSKDGTKVPMFIVYKKGIKRDGSNPTLLYGYGGFAVTLNPGFNANRILWLENGGVYAMANLRGGNEYGEEWHLAGTKMNKQNVFDDFISAAEYLVKEGYTNPSKLAIQGGSNGGLLVGATVNQRPDLFAVAIPQVGVMDMMRYHLFTIGWNWAPDYGTSADSPEMAEYLLRYSPVHNVRNDGTPYPAILVTTADHDDRVVPAHSFKYAAALQAADTGDKPKLIRIDSKAGHGAGKPIAKVIEEQADIYSFIFQNLGIDPTAKK